MSLSTMARKAIKKDYTQQLMQRVETMETRLHASDSRIETLEEKDAHTVSLISVVVFLLLVIVFDMLPITQLGSLACSGFHIGLKD